jgi:hypothetical protein
LVGFCISSRQFELEKGITRNSLSHKLAKAEWGLFGWDGALQKKQGKSSIRDAKLLSVEQYKTKG